VSVKVLGENINTIERSMDDVLDTRKEVGLEINAG
jgi:hypothetical protein